MSINRIAGTMLKDNLLRDGVDLSFDTDLIYFDVVNRQIGVNTATPSVAFEVNGDLIAGDMQITNNTLSVPAGLVINSGVNHLSVGMSKIINCNDPVDGTDVVNLRTLSTSISGIDLDQIFNGDSYIRVDDSTPSPGVLEFNTDAAIRLLIDNANATFIVPIVVPDITVNNSADIADVTISGSTVESANSETLTLDSDSGYIAVDSDIRLSATDAQSLVITDANNNVTTTTALTYDGTTVGITADVNITGTTVIDDITIENDTISAPSGMNITPGPNSDLEINLDADGQIVVNGDTALVIPRGTTAERPMNTSIGAIRFNTDLNEAEVFDGTDWIGMASFAGIVAEGYDGDGVTTSFIITTVDNISSSSILVDINGVVQEPGSAYMVNSVTNEIQFAQAPDVGDRITVRHISSTVTDFRGIMDETGTAYMVAESGQAKIQIGGDDIFVFNSWGAEVTGDILPSVDNTYDVGSPTLRFAEMHADQLFTSPADIAERFRSDKQYEPGTVVVLGEGDSVTACNENADPTVIGIVSTEPAYVLNAYEENAVPIALTGTVPCKVVGPINKGDLLVSCKNSGHARAIARNEYIPGTVLGKALEGFDHGTGIIKVLVWTA